MEIKMEKVTEFRTHDFYIASLLKTLGFPLIRLEKTSGKFVDFIFGDPNYEAEIAIEAYWNRQTQVIARDLIESINELKTRIYAR